MPTTDEGEGHLLRNAVVAGATASAASAFVLGIAALFEGKSAAQPVNATSHWLHGDEAAQRRDIDAAHTGVGYATHLASAIFWAAPFEYWLNRQPPASWRGLLTQAGLMSAIAFAVDYGATPKRFTPAGSSRSRKVLSSSAMSPSRSVSHSGRMALGTNIPR